MNETLAMTREAVIEDLAEHYVRGFMDTDELDAFVKSVLIRGWNHTPYNKMTDGQLLAEWNETINNDGEYPIAIIDNKDTDLARKAVLKEREEIIAILSETEFTSLEHMPSEAALIIRMRGSE